MKIKQSVILEQNHTDKKGVEAHFIKINQTYCYFDEKVIYLLLNYYHIVNNIINI